jgi:hypothetical protein
VHLLDQTVNTVRQAIYLLMQSFVRIQQLSVLFTLAIDHFTQVTLDRGRRLIMTLAMRRSTDR